ncbi:MAG: DUF1864 family protein [Robiginitomaculum sp.]|nr:DUF1864 family protein [Robiginitomaculum sp.]
MTKNTEAFDKWIRSSFVEMNTELENMYFEQEDRSVTVGTGDNIKVQIRDEGHGHIVKLGAEGNTDGGFMSAFDLLGNLGFYFASLRRHGLTNPDTETKSPYEEASALGLHLAASLGVTPRFATSHLATHNRAVDGVMKSFTSIEEEYFFLGYNTRGIFAYKRAADALTRILPLGVSHPLTAVLLQNAKDALKDVILYNKVLFDDLDVDRFFYSVRPYYKPFRVGDHIYRGANAGDFSGINEIDLLLGLCSAKDISYSQTLVDKMLFMMPECQNRLRECMKQTPLMDEFLQSADKSSDKPWFKENLSLFLEVCQLHGYSGAQHHNMLVKKYIEKPSTQLPQEELAQVTASGPPLHVLLDSLSRLRDLRLAAKRDDIVTRYDDVARLTELVS